MARIEPFENYSKEYDEWFIKNQDIYIAEFNAIRRLVPPHKFGVEIGVGTGRFALPLGIKIGVEPSKKMAEISRKHGIKLYEALAEKLPFKDKTFDFVLFVTTICFVDDLEKSFKEAYRVLKTDDFIVIGFIDKKSEVGKQYQLKREKSRFYKEATFYSVKDVTDILRKLNFKEMAIKQTVFLCGNYELNHIENGHGNGCFVVIRAVKITPIEELTGI